MGGLTTAGAIAAALLKRERTGEPSIVDVSLLATAMWQLSPMVIASKLFGFSKIPQGDRTKNPNPGVGTYRTKDDRFIALILLQSDKFWTDFVTRLGVPDMATDERFVDSAARSQNGEACVALLDEAFGSRTLAEVTEAFDGFEGVWSPFQTLDELYDDVQVIANGYLPTMTAGNGEEVQLVASPAQFDEVAVTVERAPEHGEHTELLLDGPRLRLGPDRRPEGVRRGPLSRRHPPKLSNITAARRAEYPHEQRGRGRRRAAGEGLDGQRATRLWEEHDRWTRRRGLRPDGRTVDVGAEHEGARIPQECFRLVELVSLRGRRSGEDRSEQLDQLVASTCDELTDLHVIEYRGQARVPDDPAARGRAELYPSHDLACPAIASERTKSAQSCPMDARGERGRGRGRAALNGVRMVRRRRWTRVGRCVFGGRWVR